MSSNPVPMPPAIPRSTLERPRVSLAMPVYNGENYIAVAIQSVLDQSFTDFELIVTDNASTDGTQEIVERLAREDPRIRYYRNETNIGAAANYNRGFELARGEFLKWCAHDDLIDPDHITHLVARLDDCPEASLAYGTTVCIDDRGAPLEGRDEDYAELTDPSPEQRFRAAIVHAGTCYKIFGLFRMSALKVSTLHEPYYGSDRALLAETALIGAHVKAPEATFFNREHQTRSINIDDKIVRSQWQNGKANRRAAMEHLNLTSHLWRIANRHGESGDRRRARKVLLALSLTPRQLSRFALEGVALASPALARRARVTGRLLLRSVRRRMKS